MAEQLHRATFALMEFTMHRYLISNVRNNGAEKAQRHAELVDMFCKVYAPYTDWEFKTKVREATRPVTDNLDQLGLVDEYYDNSLVDKFFDLFIDHAKEIL